MVISISLNAQSDTIYQGQTYQIVKRYPSGEVKVIGNYQVSCDGKEEKKHGKFLKLKKNGSIEKQKIFFYGDRRDQRCFGSKNGVWGFYGLNTKYFIGIKWGEYIVHPCF